MKPRIIAAAECTVSTLEVPKRFGPALRRADDFIRLGVAAAARVFAGDCGEQEPQARTGMFVGTAYGPMQTNFDVLGLIVDENQTSPTLFSHSVFNSAAGYLARLLGIPGSCFSLTDFSWPFFEALFEGYHAIVSGRLDRCLVLQIESYSDLLADARERTGPAAQSWPPGAVAWHLAAEGNGAGLILDGIEVHAVPSSPDAYLHREEQLRCGMETIPCPSPLSAAAAITGMINSAAGEELSCRLTAPYGSVALTLQPDTE